MITVRKLLTAEGFAPRFTFAGFDAACTAADAIAETIGDQIARARFVARVAAEMAELDYRPFQNLAEAARGETKQRPTSVPPLRDAQHCGETLANMRNGREGMKMNELMEVLMRRDGLSAREAQEAIADARSRVLDNGEDPEEILLEEFGLEPDYVFDLLGW